MSQRWPNRKHHPLPRNERSIDHLLSIPCIYVADDEPWFLTTTKASDLGFHKLGLHGIVEWL